MPVILQRMKNLIHVRTLQIYIMDRIDLEIGKIVDTVEDRIQDANLTAFRNFTLLRIELAVRIINPSSGRDAASVTANSERGEHTGDTAPFENVFERKNTFLERNANDEIRRNFGDTVSELSVPRTHFHRQSDTHHNRFERERNSQKSDKNVPFKRKPQLLRINKR